MTGRHECSSDYRPTPLLREHHAFVIKFCSFREIEEIQKKYDMYQYWYALQVISTFDILFHDMVYLSLKANCDELILFLKKVISSICFVTKLYNEIL